MWVSFLSIQTRHSSSPVAAWRHVSVPKGHVARGGHRCPTGSAIKAWTQGACADMCLSSWHPEGVCSLTAQLI